MIGHEVTVIALQADAAAMALTRAPERAAAPIEAIRRSATEALAEMRRVVGMLRAAEEEDLRPQPGLTDVEALVEASRAAGARVDLTLRAPERAPHASVQLAAYRIIQEALTNARRHPPAHLSPCGCWGTTPRCWSRSSTPSRRPAGAPAGRRGLRPRRHARAGRLLGGRLDAGPTDGGGFALTARLPLELPS